MYTYANIHIPVSTVLRGMLSTMIKFLAAVAVSLSCAHTALACGRPSNLPGWDFDVRFDKNSSALSIAELARLSV